MLAELISIHPSRVGWDQRAAFKRGAEIEFQSTHPVWDGTSQPAPTGTAFTNFNPPIPCGMGRDALAGSFEWVKISIHPSRVGWDAQAASEFKRVAAFQSTHPVWDGTIYNTTDYAIHVISIHPSRVGWDLEIPFYEHF